MDKYTKENRNWLNDRFFRIDKDGIYLPHQSIYGFRDKHGPKDLIRKYICTTQIMKVLSSLQFKSLLDVGGAEGFKAYIIKNIFNVNVRNCDLSLEACKRCEEIFKINSDPVDVQSLPYKDEEFDIVLCSQTLEHVNNHKKAIDELFRVAKKAVIITVPHEPENIIRENIIKHSHHAHIHSFNWQSIDYLKNRGYKITKIKMFNPITNVLSFIFDPYPKSIQSKKHSKTIIKIYNRMVPFFSKITNYKITTLLLKFDELLCKHSYNFNDLLYIVIKNDNYDINFHMKSISIQKIILMKVPYYYLSLN